MSLLNSIFGALRGLLGKERAERELDEELRGYVEVAAEAKIAAGMERDAALRAARLEMGGREAVKESVRRAGWESVFESFLQDLRFGARMLRRSPSFTAIAVLTLALGVGANTAVFSVVNAVLMRPVSAPEPDRVVIFMSTNPGGSSSLASEVKFNVWREQTEVLRDVSAYRPGSFNLTGVQQPQKADGIFVTEDYFHLFGLSLAHGRSFTPEETQANGRKVVVLSDTFWKTAFGGDPLILGRTISLNGDNYEVIGILAGNVQMENFGTPNGPFLPEAVPDVWLPFAIEPNSTTQIHYFQAVGRLSPGVTLEMANAQLQLATQEFRRKFPSGLSTSRGDVFSVQPLRDLLVKGVHQSLLILAGAVSFVLLIACANVASLLFARGLSRTQEIAIRKALGASRGRIVRQLLTESMLLSAVGSALGLGLGFAGIHVLLALNPYKIPRIGVDAANVTMNWQVFMFTVVVALLAGVLCGLIPTLNASRMTLNASLRRSGFRGITGFRQYNARALLVIGQTALALMLLIGAALFIRTLIAVRSVNPGFDAHNVVTVRTTLDPKLAKTSTIDQIIQRAVERVTALSGVEAAASTNLLPLEGMFASLPITVVGRPLNASPVAGHGNSRFMTISRDYFKVLKIPLVRGRLFKDADGAGAPGVAIINEAMARSFWPGGDPLNAQIFLGKGLGPNFDEPARQVVGVVADIHDDELDLSPEPAVFVPIGQRLAAQTTTVDRIWIIRVRAHSGSLDTAIQSELHQVIGGLPVPPLRSMEMVTVQSTARQRFNMRLLTAFGCVALVIAAIGIYGLTAYTVRQQTPELAIRMALGAQRAKILEMVIGGGLKLVLIGAAIGIAGALALTRFLSGLLYGVEPTDPATFIGVTLSLLGTGLLACYIPARRATKVNPMVALRYE